MLVVAAKHRICKRDSRQKRVHLTHATAGHSRAAILHNPKLHSIVQRALKAAVKLHQHVAQPLHMLTHETAAR